MKVGDEFIKHEFDEAIAIQQTIIKAAQQLSTSHPMAEVKAALKVQIRDDQAMLKQLQQFGKPYGASGEFEEVAQAFKDLSEETTESAGEAASEAYEAHAVLLSMKRKQQDSAGGTLKIARALKNDELRDAASAMYKTTKTAADALSASLATFAVQIATAGENRVKAPRSSSTKASASR